MLLFAPRTRGGLGITPVFEFLRAGVVAVEHLREREVGRAAAGSETGEWDWISSFAELRSEHPELVDTARARAGWRAVMTEVMRAGVGQAAVYVRAQVMQRGWRYAVGGRCYRT